MRMKPHAFYTRLYEKNIFKIMIHYHAPVKQKNHANDSYPLKCARIPRRYQIPSHVH